MAGVPIQRGSTQSGTQVQTQATERKSQSKLIAGDVAAATNGLAGSLDESEKARVQYSQ